MSGMQTEPDSTAASEAPSSDSEDSDCEPPSDPTTIIDEEWAKELLRTTGEANVTEVTCPRLSVDIRIGVGGILSRVVAVTINYDSDGERGERGERKILPVIVKLPPRDPFGRLFMAEAQFDTREILFYTELAPVLNRLAEDIFGPGNSLHIAKCYRGRIPSIVGAESELVLEDITHAGFESADLAEGLSEERARAALYAAARLHALSLALHEKEGALDERFDFLFPCERAAAGYLRLIRRGLPQLEEFLRERTECIEEADAVAALSARAPTLLGTLLRPAEPAPIVHADFWCGNLQFREVNGVTECVVLDWQMVSLGRPMDDIALLLLSSLSPELRRAIGDSLIEDYTQRLVSECTRLGAIGVASAMRRSLKADWPRAALRALLLCAGSVEMALGEPRAEARLLEAVRDLHADGVLDLKPDTET